MILYTVVNPLKSCSIAISLHTGFDVLPLYGLTLNFGSNVLKMIHILYCNPTARIQKITKQNNNASQSTPPSRGTRLGCPLSLLLFALTTEVREHTSVSGVKVGGENHVISLNADDIILFFYRTRIIHACPHRDLI